MIYGFLQSTAPLGDIYQEQSRNREYAGHRNFITTTQVSVFFVNAGIYDIY